MSTSGETGDATPDEATVSAADSSEEAPSAGLERPEDGPDIDVDAALAQAVSGDVSRGDALSPEESFSIAAASRPTVVVFAGQVGSGKTTLMTSLYERLGHGPVAGRLFAGSRTLPGFERRCHLGRIASGLASPDTERTAFDALPWLHLRTRAADLASPSHDLLLGDFYGEHFTRLVAGTTQPHEMPFLRRADHVCLIINGERIASEVDRVFERQAAHDLLGALAQDGTLASTQVLSLVLTKLDIVRRAGSGAQTVADDVLRELADELRASHADTDVPIVLTAARSTIPELPLGHGLEELLALWVRKPQVQLAHPPPPPPTLGTSAFDSFRAGMADA